MEKSKIQSRNELEFAIFCIENTAIELNKDAVDVYDAFTKQSHLLYDYIIPLYDSCIHKAKNTSLKIF